MIRENVPRLRIVLGALALVTLLVQLVVVPRTAASYAEAYPEVAHLEAPYAIAVMVAIGGFEMALLAAWQLLSAAEGASSNRTKRWANVMTASLCFMALVFAGICVHAGSVENIGGPGMLFGLLAALGLVTFALGFRSKAGGFSLRDDAANPALR